MSTNESALNLVTSSRSESEPSIRRHAAIVAKLRMPLAGLWIAARFLLVPALFVPFKCGSRMRWAFALDSFVKRIFYPLTEQPDSVRQNAIGASVPVRLPDIPIEVEGNSVSLADFARDRRVLLVLYRGSWCPYSRLHLTDLARIASEFKRRNTTVLAVSAHDHSAWWRSKGVHFTFGADPEGRLFAAMGVKIEPPFMHRVWGLLLPHESVFLFENNTLIASDIRRLSSIKSHQTFLDSRQWLDEITSLAA